METIVVALVVGAVSGLAGSILGPFLTHRLDQRRRREVREEGRNQELRHMVEAVMRLARTAHSSTLDIQLTELLTGDISPALLRHDQYVQSLEAQYRHLLWRPLRIQDVTLRRLADGLNTAEAHLHMLIGVRRGVLLGGTQNWSEGAANVRHWVDVLLMAVDQRMDELGW